MGLGGTAAFATLPPSRSKEKAVLKLRSKFPSLAMLGALGLTGAALIGGCGGDDGASADSDPQALLEETFTTDAAVDSGVLDISLEATAEGEGGGTVIASLSGPFQSQGEEAVPLLDLVAALAVSGGSEDIDFEGGLTVTSDGAFVTVDGTAYAIDDPTFQMFKDLYAQSASAQSAQAEEGSAVFAQLGIDPSTWLTEVTNEGVEEVEGEETVHISGNADIAQIVEDAQGIAQQTGSAGQVSPEDLSRLSEAVIAADVDVYTGAEDKILRRLDLALEIADTGGSGVGGPVTVNLSLGISGVNDEQSISAPEDAQPIDQLIPGGLGAIGGASIPGLTDPGAAGGTGGTGATGSGDFSNPEYLDCVAEATTPEEITGCADLL